MKPKTALRLSSNGVVYCTCGHLWGFINDVNDFIIPLLEDKIIARFNDTDIVVYPHDNIYTIYEKFVEKL